MLFILICTVFYAIIFYVDLERENKMLDLTVA